MLILPVFCVRWKSVVIDALIHPYSRVTTNITKGQPYAMVDQLIEPNAKLDISSHESPPEGNRIVRGRSATASEKALSVIKNYEDVGIRETTAALANLVQSGELKLDNMAPLLPYLLTIRGEPYTLKDHFVMEPMFTINVPWKFLVKCGRQVSKSTSLAAQGVIQSALLPHFRTLYVLPLYEMTRRFSSNYIKPFIEESAMKHLLLNSNCDQNVLQRTFINKACMFFSFALLNCDRTRGISADKLVIDECQDMDWDFIPIMAETLSASKWGIHQYSGTPKTFDNTIQALWEDSSQAEWVIKCGYCGYQNIPNMEFDVINMIGPVSNIAKYGTGLICAKCGRPLDSRVGVWVHQYRDKFTTFPGYHVPQIVLPMHYGSEKKWIELLNKRDTKNAAVFLNECLGESCDVGLKLITLDELKSAACLHDNDWHVATKLNFTTKYLQRIIGVDWGGGGQDEISYTTIAVVGLRPDYKQEVIYIQRLHAAVSDVDEISRILEVFTTFQCHYIAHDYAGAGSVHETLLIQAGFPVNKIVPFNYMKVTAKPMIYVHGGPDASRHYYVLDKSRSLLMLCTLLKTLHLLLPSFESCRDLVEDFLHINKETQETGHHGSILLVKRQPKQSDDIVHAINYAACAHFHTTQVYPDIAKSFGVSMTEEQQNIAHPIGPVNFDL